MDNGRIPINYMEDLLKRKPELVIKATRFPDEARIDLKAITLAYLGAPLNINIVPEELERNTYEVLRKLRETKELYMELFL